MFTNDCRFLVVDDFKTMRSIVKKTLQGMGFTDISEAEDGAQAWKVIQAANAEGKPFHCIVCDWNMPNMSGLELLKLVRNEPSMLKLPFLLVTAENEQKQVLEAAKAGVSNYVVKPFTPVELKNKLQLAYNKHFPAKAA